MAISTSLLSRARSGDREATQEVFEMASKAMKLMEASSGSFDQDEINQKIIFPFMAAANGGHPEAQLVAANLFMQMSDASDPEIYNQAIGWLRSATDQGLVAAAVRLTNLLLFNTVPDMEGALECALKISQVATENEKGLAVQEYQTLIQFSESEGYAQADVFRICIDIVNHGDVVYNEVLKELQS